VCPIALLRTSTKIDLLKACEGGVAGVFEPVPVQCIVDCCDVFIGMWGEEICVDLLANGSWESEEG